MTLEQNITAILETHFNGFKDELIEACAKRIAEQVEKQYDTPQMDSDCNGCRFVGMYDTQFPCASCVRKNKDYYDSEYMEGSR